MRTSGKLIVCVIVIFCLCASCSQIYYTQDDHISAKKIYFLMNGIKLKLKLKKYDSIEVAYSEEPPNWVYIYIFSGSTIYMTNNPRTPNFYYIHRIDPSIVSWGFSKLDSNRIFEGIDSNSLHWKEFRFSDFAYGYNKVTSSNKPVIDSLVNSIQIMKSRWDIPLQSHKVIIGR